MTLETIPPDLVAKNIMFFEGVDKNDKRICKFDNYQIFVTNFIIIIIKFTRFLSCVFYAIPWSTVIIIAVHYKVARYFRGDQGEEMKRYISYLLEGHFRKHMSDSIIVIFDFTGAGISNMVSSVFRLLAFYVPVYNIMVRVIRLMWGLICFEGT